MMMSLKRAMIALSLLCFVVQPVVVEAQVDPAARGLAVQARTAAASARPFVVTPSQAPSAYSLKRWRRALARAAIGSTTVGLEVTVGDSTQRTVYGPTPAGVASTIGGPTNGGALLSVTNRLAAKIAARGYKTTANAVFGMNTFTAAQYVVYEPRVTLGAGWGPSSNQSLGGPMFLNTTDTSALAIAFVDPCNTIRVRYRQQATAGQFTIDIGGAALSTVTTTGSEAFATATASTGNAAATLTVNTKRVSGTVEIIGVECYDATNPGIIFVNASRGSWNSTNWLAANQPWAPQPAVAAMSADLIIDGNSGVNDVDNLPDPTTAFIPVATFTSNKQANINAWKAGSDILLLTHAPQDVTYSVIPNQLIFRQAVLDLGTANNFAVADWYSRVISRADANLLTQYGDARHPGPYLADDEATWLAGQLTQ